MRVRLVHPVSVGRSILAVSLLVSTVACATSHSPRATRPAPGVDSAVAVPALEATSVGGRLAVSAVFRVICTRRHSYGTGFLHRSGRIITAAHVVDRCDPRELVIRGMGQEARVARVVFDRRTDLALLTPDPKLSGQGLPISERDAYPIGLQVTTWGFPEGYLGKRPLLSVGYLSGQTVERTGMGPVQRWVVNAAFNSGNSGGPLLDLAGHAVMGVVCSKLAPLPPSIGTALAALQRQRSGALFRARRSDGTIVELSEGEVVARVLDYLRRQMQLVIGYAATSGDLRRFLDANGVQP